MDIRFTELPLPQPPTSGWVRAWHAFGEGEAKNPRSELRTQLHGALARAAAEVAHKDHLSVKVRRDSSGRPFLDGLPNGYSCSLAYSGKDALAVLGFGARVGGDLASSEGSLDWRALSKEYFSTAEIAVLAQQGKDEKARQVFCRFWSRMESLAKASGQGFDLLNKGVPLSGTAVAPGTLGKWTEAWSGKPGYWIVDLPLPTPFVGSVAWKRV